MGLFQQMQAVGGQPSNVIKRHSTQLRASGRPSFLESASTANWKLDVKTSSSLRSTMGFWMKPAMSDDANSLNLRVVRKAASCEVEGGGLLGSQPNPSPAPLALGIHGQSSSLYARVLPQDEFQGSGKKVPNHWIEKS
jgi:hypothetical protein